MMNFFLPYQKLWIQDHSRIKIMEKSRQIGMSWAAAYALVRRQSTSHNHLDAWVSSRDQTQARLFLEDCKAFAKTLNLATSPLGTQLIPNSKKSSSLVLQFSNNSRIHSLSSNPNAQAGKRGSRLLDEFALHANPQHLYTIAYPGITWGGQLEIISTHRGATNFFNRLIQEITLNGNPKKISHHRVTLQNALDQGLLKKLKQKLPHDDPRLLMDDAAYFDFIRLACPDYDSFMQEYMCEPFDESSLFIPTSLIESCEYPTNSLWELSTFQASRTNNDFYLGVDIGRDHDLTVFWLLEDINGTLFTRQLITLQNSPFSTQERILHELLSIPNLRRTCIDQTGLGRQFTEQAIHHFGAHRIEGLTFTNPLKETLAYTVRSTLENNALRIPSDKLIRADLRAIKRQITPSGNIRFCADRGKNGHADRFWALALAIYASKNSYPSPFYFSLPKPSRFLFL